ncbi:hypothetical protein [Hydrogenimonas sp.]
MLETILEQYTIEVVVNRTRISRKNLEKLKSGDFKGFTKPQAYGFVRILEREFGENFDELREEMDQWFRKNDLVVPESVFLVEEKKRKGLSKRWIVAGLLTVIVVLGFYLLQREFLSGGVQDSVEERRGEVEENVSTKTPLPPKPREMVERSGMEKGETKDIPTKNEASRSIVSESNVTEKDEESVRVSEKEGETVTETPKKEENASEAYVPMESVALTPHVRLWFGVIDLETGKRVAKVSSDVFEFEPRGRKLLVTGHGQFEINDAFGNLFKFKDAKKHYFLIDDGTVEELSSEEFKRLNGGKEW